MVGVRVGSARSSLLFALVHGHGAEREDAGRAGTGAHRQGGGYPYAGFWHEGKEPGQGGAMGSTAPPGPATSIVPGGRTERPLCIRP